MRRSTNKDAEIKKLNDTIIELKNSLAKIEQDRKDAAWAALKNKIPPGWIDTPEREAEIRKMAETDPLMFSNKLADHRLPPDTRSRPATCDRTRKTLQSAGVLALSTKQASGRTRGRTRP